MGLALGAIIVVAAGIYRVQKDNVAYALPPAPSSATPKPLQTFIESHCLDCHDSDSKKGGLDLTALKFDLSAPQTFAEWVTVHDRVRAGEMPPKKKARPDPAEAAAFTRDLSSSLTAVESERTAREGRATQRRMNRYEYESTLQDLLSLPYLDVKDFLPEDSESYGFNKIGDSLDVSHVQMARYLSAAEFALRQAIAPQIAQPKTTTERFYTWNQAGFIKRSVIQHGPRNSIPLVGLDLQVDLMIKTPKMHASKDPVRREKEAVAMVVSTYEPQEIQFNRFRAPVSGRYKLTFSGYSIWIDPKYTKVTAGRRPEPVTIYSDTPPRRLRLLGSFDFGVKPTVREIDTWLLAGETIQPDAARLYRDRPPDHKNPLQQPDGMPGVAFQWMEVQGPIIKQWPNPGHKVLFGDLPLVQGSTGGVEVVCANPERDAEKLLRSFMEKAYRRPVLDADVQRFLTVVRAALKAGDNFTDSMITAYTAVLSSPGFLYFAEKPGRLEDMALAERLSYFLWNSSPDDELRQLADRGELHQSKILRQQTDRLLNDPRSRRFINAFLDYWLDLRLIAGTAPDVELYPEYQLDDLLVESMTAETQLFFGELLKQNLSVTNLIESDFAMLNERLSTHYGIPGVQGVTLRPVTLPKDTVRGGLLTQASILKVTANGTTTSPVKRGVWIMSRLLGKPPPPPPPAVPAVEPDTRGATTIREQLAKHRTQATCNACHRNIDPAGFALESFDVMGGWRDRYRAVGGTGTPVKGYGHNGIAFHYSLGPKVDPSGVLPDGEKFQDVRELKVCLLRDPEQLARNLVQQLTIYATGAPIRFSDRPQIAAILARSKPSGYGVRTMIDEIVQSDLFLNK
jgi:mono/diheme cytochrome c family protein